MQFSATSHAPAAARHGVVGDAKPSGGQSLLVPLQLSATSQVLTAGRQGPVRLTSGGHVGLVPLQVSA